MTDIPIIYSAPMIRAMLDGRKTMTRRLAWQKPRIEIQVGSGPIEPIIVPSAWQRVKAGDRLWVRENWRAVHSGDPSQGARYRADVGWDQTVWRPSIHMPRWASRLTLIVTATKIERLQNISNADAQSEGIVEDDGSEPDIWYVPGAAPFLKIQMASSAAPVFKSLWIALHGEGSWEQNPEVVAISFRVIKANIDSVEARLAA